MSYGTRVQSIFYRANQCLNYAQLMLMTTYYSGFIADIFLFWLLFKFVFLPRTNIRYRSFSCSVVDWRCLYFRLAASRYFTSTNNAHYALYTPKLFVFLNSIMFIATNFREIR